MSRYFYRVERITHRPAAEDKITIIKDVREENLMLARIIATTGYLEELPELNGKYSPSGFCTYETKKGIGFNYQLLLVDSVDNKSFVVESTMQKMRATLMIHRKQEEKILKVEEAVISNCDPLPDFYTRLEHF